MSPIGSRCALSLPDSSGATGQHRHRSHIIAIAAACVLLLFMQWASGAWIAEFDGNPDEAAQFLSGRMLWEYVHDLPGGNPMQWAGQYYLHYPKIAIGHWPPGYPIIEALWSLPFGSSRSSAMALQWLIGVASVVALYTLLQPRFSIPVTIAVLIIVIATRTFQEGLSLAMADLACLLAAVLFMHAMMRLIEKPHRSSILLVFASLFAAAMIKGTAICLFPVPIVAFFVCGRRLPKRAGLEIAVGAIVIAICAAWYALSTNVVYWGGMTSSIPWPIDNIVSLTGWGFLILAVLGLRREPLSILAASMIASAVAVSFFVRAMNEPRHWIVVLPAILILDAYAVTAIPRRYIAFVLLPAVALFPFAWVHQTRTGYRDLIGQLHRPLRMLISGSSMDEGACIAQTAITEHYPASFIVRATKVLATSGWNGEDYRITASTPDQVSLRLDELAIDTVALNLAPKPRRPDQDLLLSMLKSSPAWRTCAAKGKLQAYCRVSPPAVPRKPLILDAGGRHLEEQIPSHP